MTERPISRILVALDDSPRAPHVFETANAIAQPLGASIVVLHVVGLAEALPSDALAVPPDRVLEELLERAQTAMRRIAPSPDVVVRVEVGAPVEVVLAVAKVESADLIVLGAHGYRFAERVLGTNVSRIVDRADRSVLVVR